jgi:hypothetical protein
VKLWVLRLGSIAETPDGGIPWGAIEKYCINTAPQRIPVFVVSAVAVRFPTYWTSSQPKFGVPVGPPVGEAISVQVDLGEQ